MPTKIEAAGWEFLAVFGTAYSTIKGSKDGEDERLAALLWRHMPLAKALVDLALRNSDAFAPLWEAHQKETMPFGEPPVATTKDDELPLRTFAKANDGPSAQLQAVCDWLHDGQSYFTNVMALGTYDAINTATGEQRTLVSIAAKVNKQKPEATSVLARRLREIATDLESVVATVGQPES